MPPHIGTEILYYDEIGSTNDEAKKIARNTGSEGIVVIADSQSNGKGRLGRIWSSEKGKGLYLSIILNPKSETSTIMQITLITAIIVKRAIQEYLSEPVFIKWPNDIIVSDRKICGILCESQISGESMNVIVGIGVNVNHESFENELADKATSMYLQCGERHTPKDLAHRIIHHYNNIYPEYIKRGFSIFLDEYKKSCITLGKEVDILKHKEKLRGMATNITKSGELVIRNSASNGEEKIFSGEVSVRGINGYQ